VEDDHEAIRRAWVELRRVFAGSQDRAFVGVFDRGTSEYRVCAEAMPGEVPLSADLAWGEVAGGWYRRAELTGSPPEIYEVIPSFFDQLREAGPYDDCRPVVEVYRRRGMVELLLPSLGSPPDLDEPAAAAVDRQVPQARGAGDHGTGGAARDQHRGRRL
jgi:hypothetical protein